MPLHEPGHRCPGFSIQNEDEVSAVDMTSLFLAVLFGSVGLGFFMYGRKQSAIVPLACGVALMIYPYFISNVILLVVVGVVLMAIPYFIRI